MIRVTGGKITARSYLWSDGGPPVLTLTVPLFHEGVAVIEDGQVTVSRDGDVPRG